MLTRRSSGRPIGSTAVSPAGAPTSITEPGTPGRVGWHELFAADWEKAWAFYGELFGWQKADADVGVSDSREDALLYIRRLTHGREPDPAIVRAHASLDPQPASTTMPRSPC